MYVCGSRTVLSSIAILGDLGDGFCHARLKQLLEMTLKLVLVRGDLIAILEIKKF